MLIACASAQRDRLAKTIDRLSQQVDWCLFLSVAHAQRLSDLAFVRLQPFSALLPRDVLATLEESYQANRVRNVYVSGELARVLGVFEQEKIDSVLLKGAALIGRVFEDAGTRFMADVDILVRERQIAQAWNLVRELGFEPPGDEKGRGFFKREHHHYPSLVDRNAIVQIEIHRNLTSVTARGLRFDVGALWRRAEEIRIRGLRSHLLAPDDFLAHLGVHFFLDRRKSSHHALAQLRDISETILYYQTDLDWARLGQHAAEMRISGPLSISLHLANALLAAPIPDDVLSAMTPDDLDEHKLSEFVLTRVLRMGAWDRWTASSGGRERTPQTSVLRRLRRNLPRSPGWWVDFRRRRIQQETWSNADLRTELWVDELIRKEVRGDSAVLKPKAPVK